MSILPKLIFIALCFNFVACAKTQLAQPVFLVSENDAPQIDNDSKGTATLTSTSVQKKSKKNKAYEAPDTSRVEKSVADKELPLQAEVPLALITTDYSDKTYQLVIALDQNSQVSAIKTINNKGKEKTYPLSVLGQEIVLAKAVGVSLVTLHCHNFKQSSGCPLEIEYPSNVTYGKFLRFKADLVKNASGWQLQSSGRKFTSMHLVAKKFFGLLIGVERLELR
tara:strand:- start:4885 stop:5553 length:669 start_codon:yes stop_codon:yes gene_type:complete